ncbi:hypothetical protein BH23ACT2_BH23ACT2_25050 [soil metagenome]
MARSFGVDDVLGGPPSWGVMLRRGLLRLCPRCGGDHLFRTHFRMRERCPGCGYCFEREPGFFLGAWFVNFMVLEALHFSLAMGFIFWMSANPDAGLLAPLAVALGTSVAVPIAFYPHSRTIWAAIDLGMTPLELDEIITAADAIGSDATGVEVDGNDATGNDGTGDDGTEPEHPTEDHHGEAPDGSAGGG